MNKTEWNKKILAKYYELGIPLDEKIAVELFNKKTYN